MRWLRSTWSVQVLGAVLISSLLAVAVVWPAQTVQRPSSSYADWLRAQLRVQADEAIDQALEEAAAQRPQSLRGFLESFVEALAVRQPDEDPARAFTTQDLSTEALIVYLQQRFLRLAGDVVVPRVTLRAAPSSINTPDRTIASVAISVGTWLMHQPSAPVLQEAQALPFVLSLRSLFSAQPLGP